MFFDWLFKKKGEAKTEIKGEEIGEVTHYFGEPHAAVIKIKKGKLAVGDTVYIKGHTTDFKQKIASMQIEHEQVQEAQKGQEIGVKVKGRVRIGDIVYKL